MLRHAQHERGGDIRTAPALAIAPVALIVGIAFAAMLPELVAGPGFTDSFRYNHVWTELFTRALIAGDPWPRWLGASWDGYGSPTFYFYPPLFFWIAGIVRALSGGALSAAATASLASAAVLAASGLAMRGWLRGQAGARAATLGAIAYMLAPYHLYDIYCRGALAEATAYALLPVALLGIRRRSVPLIALGTAGLLLGHLPVALLAAVSVLPGYAVWCAIMPNRHPGEGRDPCSSQSATASNADSDMGPSLRWGDVGRQLGASIAGGLLGVALAAAYWLPALGLIPYVSADALGGAFFRPDVWFFWRPQAWPGGFRMSAIVLMTLGALGVALAGARNREGRFWAAVAGFGVAMVAGVLPWLWTLPGLAQVQFPWRMLVVVEFAAITGFVVGGARLRTPVALAGAALLVAGMTMAALVAQAMLRAGWHGGDAARAIVSRGYEEAPEYLPAGYPIPLDQERRADPGNIPLPPGARLAGDAVRVTAPATIVFRHFHFPHWRAVRRDGATFATFPAGRYRLLAARLPPGDYRLAQGPAPRERIGLAISLTALVAWIGTAIAGLKTSSPSAARPRPS